MFKWSRKISDIIVFGKPYMLGENSQTPQAFVVRIKEHVPGAEPLTPPIPDNKGGYLVAFGNACTHMGCILVRGEEETQHNLKYQPPQDDTLQKFVCGPCPCHGTSFDLTKKGLVILGPATQNLPQLKIQIENDMVIATEWLFDIDPKEETWPS